jgi:thioredoxin 1
MVNETTFDQDVLRSNGPVLVEFGAEWCVPCKQMEPILEQLSKEWNEKVKLVKVDVDSGMNIAQKFQVMSVPTLILFVNGKACERLTGKQSKERISEKFLPFF